MAHTNEEQSRSSSPHDCKNSPTLILCAAFASAAAGVILSVLLPFFGQFIPMLKYKTPTLKTTPLARYRLVVSSDSPQHHSRRKERARCVQPPSPVMDCGATPRPTPRSCSTGVINCDTTCYRRKSLFRRGYSQAPRPSEWLASVNDWRRKSFTTSSFDSYTKYTRSPKGSISNPPTRATSPSTSPRVSVSDSRLETASRSSTFVTLTTVPLDYKPCEYVGPRGERETETAFAPCMVGCEWQEPSYTCTKRDRVLALRQRTKVLRKAVTRATQSLVRTK